MTESDFVYNPLADHSGELGCDIDANRKLNNLEQVI
jgi:hypothetical protein